MTPARSPGHVVVDASVVVDLLASTDAESPLAQLIDDSEVEIHVPELCDIEVAAGGVSKYRLSDHVGLVYLLAWFDLVNKKMTHC